MKKSSSSELLISAGIVIAIVAILLSTFGITNIKYWLTYPISPKENNAITVSVEEIKKEWDHPMVLNITNNTDKIITDTSFYITTNGKTKLVDNEGFNKIEGFGAIFPHETIPVTIKVGSGESYFKAIENKEAKDISIKTRIKTISYDNVLTAIENESDNETTIENKSYLKIILIAAILLILGILYALDITDNTIIRAILGVGVFPLLAVFIIFAFLGSRESNLGGESSSGSSYEEQKKKMAAETYKKQAVAKAGFERSGNAREAARAQARMDAAMADMIGSGNKHATESYKRNAMTKAGFEAAGNKSEAARAQARMDSALADMIADKDK